MSDLSMSHCKRSGRAVLAKIPARVFSAGTMAELLVIWIFGSRGAQYAGLRSTVPLGAPSNRGSLSHAASRAPTLARLWLPLPEPGGPCCAELRIFTVAPP